MSGWQRRQIAFWGTLRARLGAVVGMVGGTAVAVATFMPWLVDGRTLTGWDLSTRARDAGHNPWFIIPGDTPWWSFTEFLYTGLTTLVLGALMLLGALVLLVAHAGRPPTRLIVRTALVGPAALGGVVALVVTSINLFEVWWGPRFPHLSVGVGLWVAFTGAVVGTLGVGLSTSGKGRRAQQRWERENNPSQPE